MAFWRKIDVRRTLLVCTLSLLLTISVGSLFVSSAAKRCTLEFWVTWSSGPWNETVHRLREAFVAKNPDIDINILATDLASTEKFLTAVVGGSPPDVSLSIWTPDFAMRGAVTDLTPFIEASNINMDNYLPAQLQRSSWGGKVYGIPAVEAGFIFGLTWNKQLFREAGLDPEVPPADWEELGQFSDKITQMDSVGNITTLGFDPMDGEASQVLHWASSAGVPLFDYEDEKYQIDHPQVIEAVDFVASFFKKYGPENFAAYRADSAGDPRSAFMRGKQAMIINGYWMPGEIARLAPELEYGISWSPSRTGDKFQTAGGWSAVIPTGAKHPEEAWQFIEFLASDEANAIVFDTVGTFVVTRSFVDTVLGGQDGSVQGISPGLQWYVESGFAPGVTLYPEVNVPGAAEARDRFRSLVDFVAYGKRSAKETMEELQSLTQQAYDEAIRAGRR